MSEVFEMQVNAKWSSLYNQGLSDTTEMQSDIILTPKIQFWHGIKFCYSLNESLTYNNCIHLVEVITCNLVA